MADHPPNAPDPRTAPYFALFNEIAIVEQLSRTMFQERLPNGLTVPHFSVVNHLVRVADGRTPLQLATAFQVPKTTMTHTLSGLARHGLVELRPNPRDGRSKRVWLTEAGRAFREGAMAALDPDLAEVATILPKGEVEALLPVLVRLREWLDARRDQPED
jgi:DNA-binding MarR family transcriptional regulator